MRATRWARFGAVGILLAILLLSAQPAGAFDRLVVFGDSLVDVGNTFQLTNGATPASPPYFQGRQSNGPLWVEDLAPILGVPTPTASLLGGPNATDFGYSGATTTGGAEPSVTAQVTGFLAANSPQPQDLFILWGGTNDFLAGQLDSSLPAVQMGSIVSTLIGAGAKNIVILNLPPLGETPAERNNAITRAIANALADGFNSTLDTQLTSIRAAAPADANIWEVDVHALFEQILASPAKFGLLNVIDPALTFTPDPTIVPNPDQYLFWDTGHPTAAGHALLANYVAGVVPEPVMAAIILPLFLLLRRGRRAFP